MGCDPVSLITPSEQPIDIPATASVVGEALNVNKSGLD